MAGRLLSRRLVLPNQRREQVMQNNRQPRSSAAATGKRVAKWDNFWGGVVVNARDQIVDGHGHLVSRTGRIVIRNGLVVRGQS
jgi:hypothetical protein